MILALVGLGVGAATYLAAKKKEASTGTAAAAGAVVGGGSVAALWALGVAIAAAPYVLVGAGAYGVYTLVKSDDQKALPPGPS